MVARSTIWMVLTGVVAGVIGGYLVGSGVIAKGNPPEAKAPTKSVPPRDGKRVGTLTLIEKAQAELLQSVLGGSPIAEHDPSDLLEILTGLWKAAENPRSTRLEMFEAYHQFQLIIDSMPPEKAREMLGMLNSDPKFEGLKYEAESSLVARIVDADIAAGFQWALATKEPRIIAYALQAVAERDPITAAELVRSGDLPESPEFATRLGKIDALIASHAVQGGPQLFKEYEDILDDIGNYAQLVPVRHMEAFAEMALRGYEEGAGRSSGIEPLLSHWAVEDRAGFLTWYRSRAPEALKKNDQIVHTIMSSILRYDRETGLDFAGESFQASPRVAEQLFRFTVANGAEASDLELWPALVERMPDDSKPKADVFYDYDGQGFSRDIFTVRAASRCLTDPNELVTYLRAVLKRGLLVPSNPDRAATQIHEFREEVAGAELPEGSRRELLDLIDHGEKTAREDGWGSPLLPPVDDPFD